MAGMIRGRIYKNIIGDTKSTIDAIQRFLEKNSDNKVVTDETDNQPCESLNRILNSVASDDITEGIDKIIGRL